MKEAKQLSYLLIKSKTSRLEFFELLEEIYWYNIEKLTFYWKQSKEFEGELYFLVFHKLISVSEKSKLEKLKLKRLLNKLDINILLI